MFKRILIANRGEVAARVARTAARMGIQTVAVVSEVDRELSWLDQLSDVVQIGGARATESYLDQGALLEVARHTRCSAVHPGWGFLSENAIFAERCAAAGLSFVGPSPAHLRQMGDKVLARATLAKLGLPIMPGSPGPLRDAAEAESIAERVGFPVLLKAVAGGGGRGMRTVHDRGELDSVFALAVAEASSAFGDGRMYLERRMDHARHVEVQVLGDRYGHVIHLGDRECSLQRRYQKVVEEGPSPALSPEAAARLRQTAAAAAAALGYQGAGTLEFLVDAEGQAWFMEWNPRLQVEHGVTELLTGVDLVEWQLRVAANEPLSLRQDDMSVRGHALEVRINAEDPDADFRPSPGRLTEAAWPRGPGVRVDTHLSRGDRIAPNYDSLMAKVMVHTASRAESLAAMRAALDATQISGPTHNRAFLADLLTWPEFVSGNYHTGTLENRGGR